MVTRILSSSPEETTTLGQSWGREAQPGWVIALSGDLGAGKTQLVKGLARGLGIPEPILSPTYVLVHEYRTGRLPLFHLDLYRLTDAHQVRAAGLEDYLTQSNGVSVVEWFERWESSLPPLGRKVRLEWAGETERIIHYEDTCP